ncbi:hypothetical protein CONPUDRAFT_90104 [Coniophora puteana RWD-64-598 SS2]|uniref:DNA mismatch repair proteins mutS family domain-containing protein n=1 Tax=Coniophora puteana (strain RWD-64-598) TaxID=741705 RepID=A0A5M3MQW7_CONPW|nr:uncharacterized protein CONPUDRAFT_90104 [Coniophora puteana RWD-64-598 SS2]EIW81045.1 hypothetical protein CONPUDRAFT_90104 [Coniophora puteana RWD-64-598 SS2]
MARRTRARSTGLDASDLENELRGSSPKKVRWQGNVTATTESEKIETIESTEEICESLDRLPGKVCLTVLCRHGRISCAYYHPTESIIYVLEDTQESRQFDNINMVLDQCQPDVVLTSSQSDDDLISLLQGRMEASAGIFQIRPHKEFVAHRGRERFLSLKFLSELEHIECNLQSDDSDNSAPRNAYEFMKQRSANTIDPTMARWNAAIRMANFASVEKSPLCMASIGALLDFLVRERAAGDLDDAGIEGLDVRNVMAMNLDGFMQINADALYSLQVFENESHASIHSDKTKEGLSLFGILDTTRTTLGRALMRTWLLRPSLSTNVIEARHNAVECLMYPQNLPVVSGIAVHLQGIKDIPRVLRTLKAGKAVASDWQKLMKFTYHSAIIRDALVELSRSELVDIIGRLTEALDIGSYKELGNIINNTIDWEESSFAGRVCVRSHIDEELDQRKRVYHGIDSVLSTVAAQISNAVPSNFTPSLNVVYFPQLGYLVCIPMPQSWPETQIQLPDGWTLQSAEMHDMDEHIGDLHPSIVDREIEIIQGLLEQVLGFEDGVIRACDLCAELDCLISFAETSESFNYSRPRMVKESVLWITQGRHPLQEQVVDTFVENDLHIVGGGPNLDHSDNENEDIDGDSTHPASILICTGANACGKSVYLKQAALIQILAQVSLRWSSFVPAKAATLGIVDKIFTRIQTRESVSRVQSAFMIDLNQVSFALRNCTSRSLVLLDEFGKGTAPADGVGLFCGVLKHLLGRRATCPMVIIATHFHEAFRKQLMDRNKVPITFVHMQVLITEDSDTLEDTPSGTPWDEHSSNLGPVTPNAKITYLYRVAPGLSVSSHAAQCAAFFGLPTRVVNRAEYVSELLAEHEIGTLLDEDLDAKERAELEDAESICRDFLAWDLTGDEAMKQTNVKESLHDVLRQTSDTG